MSKNRRFIAINIQKNIGGHHSQRPPHTQEEWNETEGFYNLF